MQMTKVKKNSVISYPLMMHTIECVEHRPLDRYKKKKIKNGHKGPCCAFSLLLTNFKSSQKFFEFIRINAP